MGSIKVPKYIPYEDISVGDTASRHVQITNEDVLAFSSVIGDRNSFHVVDEYAQQTVFKRRVTHGVHLLAFLSTLIGEELPGFGAIYCSHEINFLQPVEIGEEIVVEIRVTEKMKHLRLRLYTSIRKQDGSVAVEGVAVVRAYA